MLVWRLHGDVDVQLTFTSDNSNIYEVCCCRCGVFFGGEKSNALKMIKSGVELYPKVQHLVTY